MKKLFSNKYFLYALFILAGFFIGLWVSHKAKNSREKSGLSINADKGIIWTCAMHPQIRMTHPGKCPICGMDLIPLNQEGKTKDASAVHLTREAAQLANVLTSVVSKIRPVKEIRLYGKVQADERLLQNQVSQISGRIEKLNLNFTGESVQKGQVLALIYSPQLVTAQQELLEASKTKQSQPEIYEAAKERLRQWKLTGDQVAVIENSGRVQNDFSVVSSTRGIITDRRVSNGDYVDPGTVLYEVADLTRVWIMFDAYETDLPFIKAGDRVRFSVQAMPGTEFTGKIGFIDPVVDPVTRVSKVRVEVSNDNGNLKPEMFVTGMIEATLNNNPSSLVIPETAVLWTGKRSIVYVKQPGDEPLFKMREIELGPYLGDSYVVENGLEEGEEIVTRGTFSVDASAQLEGKSSMMNPQGGNVNTMPGMNMPGMNQTGIEVPGIRGNDAKGAQQQIQAKGDSMSNM